MIYLDIVGRCGNQMFQYAFAKKISILNDNESIIIDYFHVHKEAERRVDNTFRNNLDDFNARESFKYINQGGNKIYKYGSREQIIVFKIYTKIKRGLEKFNCDKRFVNKLLFPIMSYFGIYWYYAPEKLKKCKQQNKFIWGYFENPTYFDDIREQLINDFTPRYDCSKCNQDLYEIIRKKDSVCLSIRKWEDNEPVNADRFVCNEIYYRNAIKRIKQVIPEAVFIVFSNNPEWVKKHFPFLKDSVYESGNDPIYEKLRLMYSCDSFILSNSTFAWWAQYLGQCKKKVIIAPECWNRSIREMNLLIQKDFQKVSINHEL